MILAIRAVATGLLAAALTSSAACAAALALADEDMAEFQIRVASEANDSSPVGTSSGRSPQLPEARGPGVGAVEPAAGLAILMGATPKPSPFRIAVDRLLSDGEADLITAAGFLFPVTSFVTSRIAFGKLPGAVTMASKTGRRVIVMPRPPNSAIIDISRF